MLYHNNGGKKWWYMFRDPARSGKFIRRSTGTDEYAKAKQIEQAAALALKGKIDQKTMTGILSAIFGSDQKDPGMRFDEAWDVYTKIITQRGRKQSEKTRGQIKKNLDDLLDWASDSLGLRLIREITNEVALEYSEKLRRQKLKDKSRKNYICNLSSVWRVLSGIEPAIGNPWLNYSPAVRDSVRHGAFTVEQERAILEAARACKDPTWEVLCLIARHTGLRKGDVVRLKYGQVDLQEGVIRQTPSKTEEYGIAVNVPMVGVLRASLVRWIEAHRPRQSGWMESDYLFPAFAKAYPGDTDVTFKDILKAAGITDETLTFHSYRHTFRTRLAESGAPDELTKRLGGWTQDKTLARYDHAEKTEEIREMIENAVK